MSRYRSVVAARLDPNAARGDQAVMVSWPIRPLRALAEVALGRQRSPEHDQGPNMVPYLRAANVKDGVLALGDVKEMDFSPAEQQTFALESGDVLVSEGAGSLAAVGASAVWTAEIEGVVCFQNTLLRLRPRPGNDARYLMWWARHAYGSGLFASIASGANIYHLGAERVRLLPVAMPNPREQHTIADYLDAETARIDQVVSAYQQELALVALRKRATASEALARHASDSVPVRRLVTKVTSGPRGWSGLEVESPGQLFLRIANVPADSISLKMDDVAYINAPGGDESERCRVRSGDVLTTITAAIGQVAVVPGDIREAYISQHLALLRPNCALVSPEWLALALWSEDAQRQLDAARYGGTKQQLSLDDIREIRVPLADLTLQQDVANRIVASLDALTRVEQVIRRLADLLVERRQALITAAVTGQLEIPGVAA